MKFVCDKCKTKYSIADDKVRRKVLKIRCKNCANIIVVREPTLEQLLPEEDDEAPRPRRATGTGLTGPRRPSAGRAALDSAFDKAFSRPAARRPQPVLGPASAPALARALPDADEYPEEEATQLDARDPLPEAGSVEDEWYLAVDGHQFGPMGFSELCSRVKRGEARSETGDEAFVWRDGLDDWVEIANVPELRPYVPPPPPRGGRSGLMRLSEMGAVDTPPPVAAGGGSQVGPVAAVGGSQVISVRAVGGSQVVPAPSGSQVMPVPAPGGSQVMPVPAAPPPMAAPPPVTGPVGPPASSSISAGPMQASHSQVVPVPTGTESPPADEAAAAGLAVGASFSAAPVPAAVPQSTPLSTKLAAVGGIVSTLTGIVLLVYFLAFDRQQEQPAPPQKAALASQVSAEQQGEGTTTGSGDKGDDEGETKFEPVRIERSGSQDKVVQRSKPTRRRTATSKRPAATPRDVEDEARKKRLLALYKKERADQEQPVPAKNNTRARARGPRRRLGPADLSKVQRANKGALHSCYQRALKRDHSLTDVRVDVQLDIGGSGVVRSVQITGSDSVDLTLCLKRSLKRWVFPAVGAQPISFPLIFRGS